MAVIRWNPASELDRLFGDVPAFLPVDIERGELVVTVQPAPAG